MTGSNNKILLVTSEFPPQPGGIGNHALNLAIYLDEEGFEVLVLADDRSEDGKAEKEFDKKFNFRVIRVPIRSFRPSIYFIRLINVLRYSKGFDLVVATGKFSLWTVGLLSQIKNIKSVAIVHGKEVNFKNTFLGHSITYSLKQFSKIIAVSNFTKSLMDKSFKNIYVIPNGININDWTYINSDLRPIRGNPSLVTVGRISVRKGQLKVINALPDLLNEFPGLHYHCVGIDPLKDIVNKSAIGLKVRNSITFHGALPDIKLKQILSSAKIKVMLSVEDGTGDVEGFGIAILEANSLGVPAIGSKNCGLEDAISDGVSGILVDPSDSAEITAAISTILMDYEHFSQGAKEWAKQHDWSLIIRRYLPLLK